MNTCPISDVEFPAPQNLNINMMPFIMGDHNSLPDNFIGYQPILDLCRIGTDELGQVGYLTIMETAVDPGLSQRRGGVHVERHPAASWGGGGWGRGGWNGQCQGGIYMGSNMGGTTAVWDYHVDTPGPGGDVEYLRPQLGDPYVLSANELVWMTDGTPHESLPITEAGTRQFFRLVTSQVDLWYAKHSTPNPLGIIPPSSVRIVTEDKFV